MKRRRFVQVCAAAAGARFAAPAVGAGEARSYKRVKLVDERGTPIAIDALKPNTSYVFDYPFASTPCFLLRLDAPVAGDVTLKTEAGDVYRWTGGIGPGRNVVAYSAICAHKMTYPTKQVSFIGYREEPSAVAPGKVITCCSDRSVYDPSAGARVVSGPAPQPLATILLEQDAKTGEIFAVGTFGGEMFAEFFRRFDFRLQLERGPRAKQPVEGTAVVQPLDRYSTQWARC